MMGISLRMNQMNQMMLLLLQISLPLFSSRMRMILRLS